MTAPFLLLALSSGGCAHWGTNTVYGDRREVGRRWVGAPQVAESTDANMFAGFSGYGQNHGNGLSTAAGGMSSRSGSFKLTHCVQNADIDYLRPYTEEPAVKARELDMIVAGGLALAGVLTVGDTRRRDVDADQYGFPDGGYRDYDPTARYAAGGVMIGSGLAIGLYSLLALPADAKPAPRAREAQWTERALVESTGCGLVPGDTVAPASNSAPLAAAAAPTPASAPPKTAADRIRELDGLRMSGMVTDAEYQTRKKAILEGI